LSQRARAAVRGGKDVLAICEPMTTTKLDLTGLKCPLPALKTRKALKALKPGDLLEVRCTDPLSVIDIPNLIRETGDKVEITERAEQEILFLIEKGNGLIEMPNG
jgi:tRNA 2-thiouridine synthesizing protein A